MYQLALKRKYTTGWYSLSRDNAVNGFLSTLSERKGIDNISILSCTPAQFGDKGYNISVSYQEDLDKTFEFPEGLDRVIFLDVDSFLLPYNVKCIASITNAGIVLASPALKDEYYDEGIIFPRHLLELMDDAKENGTQIVGITPSTKDVSFYNQTYENKIEESIIRYLDEHPSINKYIIVSKEKMNDLAPYLFRGEDISWCDEDKAKAILKGKLKIKSLKQERPYYY